MAHELLVQPEFEFNLPQDLMLETDEAKLVWKREITVRFNKQNPLCAECGTSEQFMVDTKADLSNLILTVRCVICVNKKYRAYEELPPEVQRANLRVIKSLETALIPSLKQKLIDFSVREGVFIPIQHELLQRSRSYKTLGTRVLREFLDDQNLVCVDCGADGWYVKYQLLDSPRADILLTFTCISCRDRVRKEKKRVLRNKQSRIRRKLNKLISNALIVHNTMEA